ncbi:hypothetical protein E2I00_003193, partial [Balaenoptera physalus]
MEAGKANFAPEDSLKGPSEGERKGLRVTLTPPSLMIRGIILYLQLPWITAQAGTGAPFPSHSRAQIARYLALGFSHYYHQPISAISANGKVKAGGTYFLVLHSLGLELGSSIGIFAFSCAVAVAVHTVGFTETLLDLFWEHGVQLPNMDPENEFPVVGLWKSKAGPDYLLPDLPFSYQLPAGDFLPINPSQQATGFFGYQVTGVLTRTSISRDLKVTRMSRLGAHYHPSSLSTDGSTFVPRTLLQLSPKEPSLPSRGPYFPTWASLPQLAFEDLVVLQQVQKPPPKENLASTSLNTPAPSGYIPEQDLKTNQK